MSFHHIDCVRRNRDPDLDSSSKFVLLMLATRCGDDDTCWPSIQNLADDLNMSPRSVMRHLQKLERMGFLSVIRVHRKTNVYRMNVSRVTDCHSIESSRVTNEQPLGDKCDISRVTPVTPLKKEESQYKEKSCSTELNDGPNLFDVFWKKYPRKQGKENAIKAFYKHKFNHKTLPPILDALDAHIRTWKDPAFIPLPATWLNGKRWEDELTPQTQERIRTRRDL